jgi:hypothetical protein
MPRKKKKEPARPAEMRWEFDPEIPTRDFFEEGPLEDIGNLEEAVEHYVWMLEQGDFLTWEAVVREEQGLPLTAPHKKALGRLISFGDPGDEDILYINEAPRPSEPWYVILNKIVPHLVIEPFRTFDTHWGVNMEGWHRINTALDEHAQSLSLPPGVASFREVVPADLRHKLWLQYCYDILGGLGKAENLYLEEDDPWRIDEFLERLRECKESVAYFDLSLESLLTRVILPERDRPLFVKLMQARLGLASAQESIAGRL